MEGSRNNIGAPAEKENGNGNENRTTPTDSRGSADVNDSSGSPKARASSEKKNKKKLPPFLDHFNSRDLKILIRCSVSLWVASLLIFINPTLQVFGTATFFGCIVNLFLPPNGVVFVFLIGGTTMILGMALAWAWGVISMKAALATRPAAETLARQQLLAQTASREGVSAQILVYDGFMLDTRVTVTYFCMLGLFLYLMVGALYRDAAILAIR